MQVLIGENCGIFSIYEFQSNTDAHGLQIHFEKEVKQFLNLLKKKKKKTMKGGEFGREWLCVYVWLNPFTVHLKLSQKCLLIGYNPIQN